MPADPPSQPTSPPLHEATLHFDEALVRRAVWAFWRKTAGFGVLAALAMVAMALAWQVVHRELSWTTGALATVLIVGVGLLLAIYVSQFRVAMGKFRAMKTPHATLAVDEGSLTLASDLANTTMVWSAVTEVWRFSDFWLLLFSKSQFVTIPLATLDGEMQTFILDRVKAAGGAIQG